MAEEQIKRINFFNGQFLKEEEFREEQKYHIRMRRHLNYVLFEQSGVISVKPDDLEFDINDIDETFKVKAGMAISRNESDIEAKEIILMRDSGTLSLSNQKIWVTINYDEETAESSSEGGVTGDTRTLEKAVIEVHTSEPDETAANGEEYILLGTIEPDGAGSWQANYDDRQEAKIRASLLGVATVNLVSIEVVPAAVTIEQNATRQLTARGNFSDGSHRDLTTGDGLTWGSSDITKVTVDVNGLVTGIAIGSATITASAKGKVNTAAVEVVASAPELVSIDISPASAAMEVGGVTVTFTATGTFSDNSTEVLNHTDHGLVWSSSDPAIVEIGLDTGIATAVSGGTATITAEAQGKSNTVEVNVRELQSIEITSAPSTFTVNETWTFEATGTFSDNSTEVLNHTDHGLVWSSSDPNIVEINSSTGAAIAISDGTVTITAQVGNVSGQIIVEVQPAAIPPVIEFLAPARQISGGSIGVYGTNIRDSSIDPPNPATGTTIRFVKDDTVKDGLNVTAKYNDSSGRQVVSVTVPDRTNTNWGISEEVTLELTFNGLTCEISFLYDDRS
jgi:uncharacterized protein YjdB